MYDNIHGAGGNALEGAEAIVKIEIGYSEAKYDTFAAFTLYDSKCRECASSEIKIEKRTSLKEVGKKEFFLIGGILK